MAGFVVKRLGYIAFAATLTCEASRAAAGDQQVFASDSKRDGRFDHAFDEFVEQTLAAWHVPGLSIAVLEDGKTHSKGYGYATLPDTPAAPDTQWFTGSTTKAFTAAAVAQLIHDPDNYPDLGWSTPLSELIRDDFVLEDDYRTTHTTLEDALSHRSGMPGHDLMYGYQGDTIKSIVRRMRYLPMNAQPRTKWQYCNIMYVVVTQCVEALTGLSLEQVLGKRFWKPLGMESTTFNVSAAAYPSEGKTRLARGYWWDPKEHRYIAEPYLDLLPVSGAGATISTVEDYTLWMKALLSAANGHKNASSPISPAIIRDVMTPRSMVDIFSEDNDGASLSDSVIVPPVYSLGWISTDALGKAIVTHTGGLTGFGTSLYLVPEKNVGIIMMANTVGTSHYAEASIASRLLISILQGDGGSSVASEDLRTDLERTLTAAMRKTEPSIAKNRSKGKLEEHAFQQPSPEVPSSSSYAKEPFPGGTNASASIAGTYSNPAYGSFNLTTVNSNDTLVFEAYFYPRTWPRKGVMRHASHTVFHVDTYMKHGLDEDEDGTSSGEAVWEDVSGEDNIAFVELDLYGERVARLGLQLEQDMLDTLEGKDWRRDWRESMIWFEKA